MKVYVDDYGEKRLIGRADVPEDLGPAFQVPMIDVNSDLAQSFIIGVVTHLPENGAEPIVERAVLLARGQSPEALPGWQILVS